MNPGPGAYGPQGDRYKNSPSWGLGSAKRSDLANTNTKFYPGPSVYNIKSPIGEGPAFVMGEKSGSGAMGGAKNVPGPGAYSPIKADGSARYSMGSKTKFGMSIAVQPETGEHTKICSTADFTPGPGAYNSKAVFKNVNGGPRFGTDGRKGMGDEKAGRTPGPNAYRADSKRTVQRLAPAYGFGSSKRPQSVNVR